MCDMVGKYPVNEIIHGDCLEVMPQFPDKSFDMVLCDLPYEKTACEWDKIIPFKPLWKQYKRIIKDNGAIILTASQPFTNDLINSNRGWFRYCMVWAKDRPSDFGNANVKPMRYHEDVVVFYNRPPIYNKQYIHRTGTGADRMKYLVNIGVGNHQSNEHKYGLKPMRKKYAEDGRKICGTVITIPIERRRTGQHPTQKPIALFEHLIRTYSNEGDLVLDNCIGSGTTAIAAENLGRNWIGIEKEEKYVNIARERIARERLNRSQLSLEI